MSGLARASRLVMARSYIVNRRWSTGNHNAVIEPMSSLAEPPTTPDEITYFMERLNGGDDESASAPVYYCSDVFQGLADEAGSVVHSRMELFEHAIPWM